MIQKSEDLMIKPYMKGEKREKLQEFLRSSRDKLSRDDNEVMDLSTDTLQRISHFYNKDSKVFVIDQTH